MVNKPTRKKPTDADVEAMKQVYEIAEQTVEQKYKDKLAGLNQKIQEQTFIIEYATKIKIKDADEAMARFFRVMILRHVKEALRKDGKWTQFCNENGIDIKNADYEISKLGDLRDDLLLKFGSVFGFEINKIKYLNFTDSEKLGVNGDLLTYEGEIIDDIPTFIESIKTAHKRDVDNLKGDIQAKERLLREKDKHAEKLQKEIARFERNAHDKGLTLEEDAFLQRMNNLRIGFDGYMLKVDPDRVDELKKDNKPTPRMIAAYLSSLDYLRKQILAAYDTAVQKYGNPIIAPEKAWKPGMKV